MDLYIHSEAYFEHLTHFPLILFSGLDEALYAMLMSCQGQSFHAKHQQP